MSISIRRRFNAVLTTGFARFRHAVRPGLIAVAAAALAMLLTAPVSSAISGAPWKSDSDTGVVSPSDMLHGNQAGTAKCPRGPSQTTCNYWNPQACIVTDPYDNFSESFQQWNVPDCVMLDSGWVLLDAKHDGPTSGYALYCSAQPFNTPWNWSAAGFGQISAVQESGFVSYLQPALDNSTCGLRLERSRHKLARRGEVLLWRG